MQPSISSAGRHGLSRKQRLKSSKLIKEAFAQGRCFAGNLMVMLVRAGCDTSLRLAVMAGKKIGGAVARNRAKRRLREAFRLNRLCLKSNCDIVLIARDKINKASWPEVQAELIALAGQAGILKNGKTL